MNWKTATNLSWRKARASATNGGCVTVAVTGSLSFATETTEDDS
jgi:hypothetical protein